MNNTFNNLFHLHIKKFYQKPCMQLFCSCGVFLSTIICLVNFLMTTSKILFVTEALSQTVFLNVIRDPPPRQVLASANFGRMVVTFWPLYPTHCL